jgi:hypothetical protein
MRIDFRHTCAAAVALTLLAAGCPTANSTRLGADEVNWGEANRQTMAAQIIDPAPHYDYAVPETSGDHAQKAVERYRKGEVKQPERQRTTNIGVGGGGGGGGGSSK